MNAVSHGRDAFEVRRLSGSPFRTWNGVERHTLFPGVALHAIGGEQVMLCRVDVRAGHDGARHSHPSTPSR